MILTFALIAGPSLVPLVLTLVNLATWRRGHAKPIAESVSVLVPARNEARRIESCLRAVAASRQPLAEILVYDDQSSDETAAVVARLQGELPGLRLIRGGPLPRGWVGKPHACHRLAREARGEILVCLDADVVFLPDGVARLVSLLDHADVATAVPRQRMEGFVERLMMPLLIVTYTSWLPLALVSASPDPRFVAANGQLIAIRRQVLEELGGFEVVAHEIVDDVAFCRHAKLQGKRLIFGDGTQMARCRMYESGGALWRGFSKNVYEGLGSPLALAVAIVVHLAAFVVPPAALAIGLLARPEWIFPGLVGVAANLGLRAILAARFRQPLETLIFHPIAVLVLVAIALNSFYCSWTGRLDWAGRRYPSRQKRLLAQEGS